MICKHCGAELVLKEWLKRVPPEASLSQAMAEISKWENQVMKHLQPISCAEKYGKSDILMVNVISQKTDLNIRAVHFVRFLLEKYNFSTDLSDAKEILVQVEAFQKREKENALKPIMMKICSDCGGTGIKDAPPPEEPCPRCEGKGEHVVKQNE